jgi:hypothetical protein
MLVNSQCCTIYACHKSAWVIRKFPGNLLSTKTQRKQKETQPKLANLFTQTEMESFLTNLCAPVSNVSFWQGTLSCRSNTTSNSTNTMPAYTATASPPSKPTKSAQDKKADRDSDIAIAFNILGAVCAISFISFIILRKVRMDRAEAKRLAMATDTSVPLPGREVDDGGETGTAVKTTENGKDGVEGGETKTAQSGSVEEMEMEEPQVSKIKEKWQGRWGWFYRWRGGYLRL